MKIVGVNGINTHGEGNIDRLLQSLATDGYDVCDILLPKRSFISARWGADDDAEFIAEMSDPGDVLVAHSFGALRAAEAMKLQDYSHVFMFNPAMDRRYDFEYTHPETKLYCFHSKGDYTILLGSLLLLHPFGAAGRSGLDSERVTNIEISGGHNAAFDRWLPFSVSYIKHELTGIEEDVCIVH